MATEIEHKYLVNREIWSGVIPSKSSFIKQAYLQTDPEKTIRIRTKDSKGFITIKGKTQGASRPEYEYEIPINDANEMIENFCSNIVEKVRHEIVIDGKLWEVDEFKGMNEGLIIAEIELTDENENYTLPNWAEINVTNDMKYVNSNLALKPYSTW